MATATASIDVSINHAVKTLGTLKSMKHELDKEYFDDIEEIFRKSMEDVAIRTASFLFDFLAKKPNLNIVKNMIDMAPSCLSLRDLNGSLPIHHSVAEYRFMGDSRAEERAPYVTLFAEEAIKHNLFEEDERGGLLIQDPPACLSVCPLQQLVRDGSFDEIKRLREKKLLLKQDIETQGLVFHAILFWGESNLVEYFLEWEPSAMMTHKFDGDPLGHALFDDCRGDLSEALREFLEESLHRHPEEMGLIFQKGNDGQTLLERIFRHNGEEATFQFLRECIRIDLIEEKCLPILHHVAREAPQYMQMFIKYYPSAVFFRDKYGRSLRQAELASGNMTFSKNAYFFTNMTDGDLRVADPDDDLYPFMMAASSAKITATDTEGDVDGDENDDDDDAPSILPKPRCDLDAIYYLLRRDPSLAHGGQRKQKIRKRKRSKIL